MGYLCSDRSKCHAKAIETSRVLYAMPTTQLNSIASYNYRIGSLVTLGTNILLHFFIIIDIIWYNWTNIFFP